MECELIHECILMLMVWLGEMVSYSGQPDVVGRDGKLLRTTGCGWER